MLGIHIKIITKNNKWHRKKTQLSTTRYTQTTKDDKHNKLTPTSLKRAENRTYQMHVEIVGRVDMTNADVHEFSGSWELRWKKPTPWRPRNRLREGVRRRKVGVVEKDQGVADRHWTVVFDVGGCRTAQVDKRHRVCLLDDLKPHHTDK